MEKLSYRKPAISYKWQQTERMKEYRSTMMQKSADEEEFVRVLHIAHHDVQFGTQSSSHG